jgi:hypothetical protein
MSTLLIVEGKDEEVITRLILEKIDPKFKEKIIIKEGGGAAVLQLAQSSLKSSEFKNTTRLAILVDAEENREKTKSIWDKLITDFKAKKPGHEFCLLVLPTNETKGSIETVFLQSLDPNTNQVAQCAINFSACLSKHSVHSTKGQKDKLTLNSYINSNVKTP